MPRLVVAIILTACSTAWAQGDCYGTVESVSTLTFAELACREDFGASRSAEAIQSCAAILSEPEFDRVTRAADDAFRARLLREGLASVCAGLRASAGR